MASATIYPTAAYWHSLTGKWDTARDAAASSLVTGSNPASVGIVFDGSNYVFYRSYISFDLAVIPFGSTIDSITVSLYRADNDPASYAPYIAYAGNVNVRRNVNEYSLYLTHLISGPLATIRLSGQNYYTSTAFDLRTYAISPGDILAIGVIDPNDFDYGMDLTSGRYDIDVSVNRPYIEVTYTPGGYVYPVMGVSNFTDLNGVPSGTIINVMGV